ncbi:MAG: porin [Chloroflexi bacterium AL-N5]|nr:porin [Chloroflexi bacterium AL-N5]
MAKYLTEFIGTFFLVLVITLSVISGQALAPLAIGGTLMVMIFMGGHISGGHYNPAVSLAAMLRGALPFGELVPYWIAQLAGGVLAALLGNFIAGGSVAIAPGLDVGIAPAFLVEFLFTFALALTVLNVATAKGTANNSFYGLAIGFVVVGAAIAGGGISGGAFNPAVGIGLSLGALFAGTGGGWFWLYIIAPLLGGALAATVFKLQGNEDIS